MTYKVTTIAPPVTEIITVAEAKEQLRIEPAFSGDDSLIGAYISAARERAEAYCATFFTEQTISISYPGSFPAELRLPFPDLTLTGVEYIDSSNSGQVYDLSDAYLDSNTDTIRFLNQLFAESFKLTFTTSPPTDIQRAKDAVKMIVADLYEHRTESMTVSMSDNPAVDALLYSYRAGLGV
jgi:uncharacterized phiE125 gp8 family phage protein